MVLMHGCTFTSPPHARPRPSCPFAGVTAECSLAWCRCREWTCAPPFFLFVFFTKKSLAAEPHVTVCFHALSVRLLPRLGRHATLRVFRGGGSGGGRAIVKAHVVVCCGKKFNMYTLGLLLLAQRGMFPFLSPSWKYQGSLSCSCQKCSESGGGC